MNWITWVDPKSGNQTTRAHLGKFYAGTRTLCGFTVGDMTAPAGKSINRCQKCLKAQSHDGAMQNHSR